MCFKARLVQNKDAKLTLDIIQFGILFQSYHNISEVLIETEELCVIFFIYFKNNHGLMNVERSCHSLYSV